MSTVLCTVFGTVLCTVFVTVASGVRSRDPSHPLRVSGRKGSELFRIHHQRRRTTLLSCVQCPHRGMEWFSRFMNLLDSHIKLVASFQDVATEIILSLGQAFEVAYQLATRHSHTAM